MFDKSPKIRFVMESETYDALHCFASKRVGATDAADLVQEAYLRFLQQKDRQDIQEPRAFLFRIVANLSIDRWRKEQIRNPGKPEPKRSDIDSLASHRPGPEASAQAILELEALLQALADVPEPDRHAFVLNKFEGLSQADIARKFGLPEKVIQRKIAGVIAHCAKRLGYTEE